MLIRISIHKRVHFQIICVYLTYKKFQFFFSRSLACQTILGITIKLPKNWINYIHIHSEFLYVLKKKNKIILPYLGGYMG